MFPKQSLKHPADLAVMTRKGVEKLYDAAAYKLNATVFWNLARCNKDVVQFSNVEFKVVKGSKLSMQFSWQTNVKSPFMRSKIGFKFTWHKKNISGIMFCVFIFISSLVKDHYRALLDNFTRLGDTAGVWREFSENSIINVLYAKVCIVHHFC